MRAKQMSLVMAKACAVKHLDAHAAAVDMAPRADLRRAGRAAVLRAGPRTRFLVASIQCTHLIMRTLTDCPAHR